MDRLRVLILPPMPWGPARASFVPGTGPDPLERDRRLAVLGIEARVIDPHPRPWNPFAGRDTLLESLDPVRAISVAIAESDVDLIVSVFEGAVAALTALRPILGKRRKLALWDLGLTEQWRLRERILDFVVPRVDGIMVLSANQKPYIEKRWRVRAPVDVIYHSVDTEFFRPGPPASDGPILSVGEDVGRDFETLVAAMEGISADIVIKTRRQRERMQLSRYPRISVRSDWLSYLDLRKLYEQSRFVVIPLVETLNASGVSSVLEAAAMGKAMIVSASAAMRDYIVAGETCLAVPCGDPSAMRAAIKRLLAEPDTCLQLGTNARRFVERRFSIRSFADGFAPALRRIASR